MEIRQLTESDLDDLLALYSHMHISDEPLPERAIVEAVWKNIQASSNFRYYGLFINEKLLSSCSLSIIPNLSRGCRPYGLIENVVTHSKYRQKGYGTAVLRHALRYAWSQNCYKTMLLTGRKDEKTFKFYESVGFDRQAKQAFLAKPK